MSTGHTLTYMTPSSGSGWSIIRLGELLTVIQTRGEVEGLHNCLEINIAFLKKYCYFVVYKQFICKR